MEKVNFKYSKSEMVAYLMYVGYKYSKIEIKENNRYRGKYKVFFYFEGFKEDFIEIENEFNNNTYVCLSEYIKVLSEVKDIIHTELNSLK